LSVAPARRVPRRRGGSPSRHVAERPAA
jgi:hypothetical protein